MSFIILFSLLSLANVIFATYKSIITVKDGILAPALVNGFYFTFYNIVIIYTVMDVSLMMKCIITFIANVIGVAIVKYIEKKCRKDKVWKFEMTVPTELAETIHIILDGMNISHNYIKDIGKYTIFNCYCPTQNESTLVKNIADNYKIHFFVSESQNA